MSKVNLPVGVGLDPVALRDGRWFPLESAPGVEVLLRPEETREFRRARVRVLGELDLSDHKGDSEATDAALYEAEGRLLAEAVLLDWRGEFTGPDGEPLEYTPDLGASFVNDDRYLLQRKEIQRISRAMQRFREARLEELEDAVGNSSGGSSDTERS